MTRLDAALGAVYRGFRIFPVQDMEKTPHITNPPYTLKWSEVASNDVDLVRKWWSVWPNANIGVACKPSGLLVVDCDQPKAPNLLVGTRWEYLHDIAGPMADGDLLFDQMCQRYGGNWQHIQDTYRVATGSGGIHYYFRWPEGVQASQASIFKGVLDIRCNGGDKGGYVLGAGSETHKGTYDALLAAPVLPAPSWLVGLCKELPAQPGPVKGPYDRPSHGSCAGLQDTVRLAMEGNRNDTLNWASWKMGRDGYSEEEALETLTEPALDCGMGMREIEDTIRSGWKKGSRG